MFNDPENELDPMNLCLCPNCAAMYRKIRNKEQVMEGLKKKLYTINEAFITKDDHCAISVDGQELWFTQVHIAEIHSLLALAEEVKIKEREKQEQEIQQREMQEYVKQERVEKKRENCERENLLLWLERTNQQNASNNQISEKAKGEEFVGKTLRRKDGFLGYIAKVEEERLYVKVLKTSKKPNQPEVGRVVRIKLSFIRENPDVYVIG